MSYQDVAIAFGCRPFAYAIDGISESCCPGWQLLTYFTNPVDDVIRAIAVPLLAIHAHFKDIYDLICSRHSDLLGDMVKIPYILEGIIKFVATPIWLPVKLITKVTLFALPLLFLAGGSLVLPVRTIISLFGDWSRKQRAMEQELYLSLMNRRAKIEAGTESPLQRSYQQIGVLPLSGLNTQSPILGNSVFGVLVDPLVHLLSIYNRQIYI